MRQEFKEWMIAENYRVAQLYRQMLYKEYQKTKSFFGDICEFVKPVLLSSLRTIELPPYRKYEGKLDRDKQAEIFHSIPKVNKADLLAEFIMENF
jgi:hypothetical protein